MYNLNSSLMSLPPISCHLISCHLILYHLKSCHPISDISPPPSFNVPSLLPTVLYHLISSQVMPSQVIPSQVKSSHAISSHPISSNVMSSHPISSQVKSSYLIRYPILPHLIPFFTPTTHKGYVKRTLPDRHIGLQ